MARPKGIKARIDERLATLSHRPRQVEAGLEALLQSDWAAVCRTALTIDDADARVKEIFAAADLDPSNPYRWKKLVSLLADLRSQRSGAPIRWRPEELCRLMIDVDRLQKTRDVRSGKYVKSLSRTLIDIPVQT